MKIALCQLKVNEDKALNLENAKRLILDASKRGARLVALPEMFNCPYKTDLFPLYAESYPNGQSFEMLREAAKKAKVTLVGGSLSERDGDKIYNSSFIFAPDGSLLGRHRKVHLFDVDLEGKVKVKESETLSYGEDITVVNTPFGALGVAICYDLRFPEIFRKMVLKGAKIILVPAAFNMVTGPPHFELSIRARALDNQAFVGVISPARDTKASYVAYGHSMLANPWGEIVEKADIDEEILIADISLEYLDKVRQELPLLKHLREDIYRKN